MHPTERADRLQQLIAELAVARKAVSEYDARAIEARDMAAEQLTPQRRDVYTGAQIRYRGQAISWQRRVTELHNEIAALTDGPAAVAAPVKLTPAQTAAMDETAGIAA